MTAISFAGDCNLGHDCSAFAERTYQQLTTGGYADNASIMEIPAAGSWPAEHRTARKRAARARRLGYRFSEIDRSEHTDAIHEINVSLPERQGHPMSAGYLQRYEYTDVEKACPHHRVYTYGILDARETLRAYLWLYRLGDVAMISTILGHGDHLADDVMYLLMAGAFEAQAPLGGFAFYNRHDSGTPGLVYYKERCGFRGSTVEWRLK